MKQAMIFAAGLGTRLKPITDTMPKAMVRVGGIPLMQRVICKLRDAGFDHLVVNVHHFANQITDFLKENDNFGLDIRISDETAKLLDTGGGIRKAVNMFNFRLPILIHNVDILSNVDLVKFYGSDEKVMCPDCGIPHQLAGAQLLVSWRKTKRYLVFNQYMLLVGWVNIETGEVRSPWPEVRAILEGQHYPMTATDEPMVISTGYNASSSKFQVQGLHLYAFSGIHLFSPRMFPYMVGAPDKFPIMDFYLAMCKRIPIRGIVKPDLQLMDVGKLDTLHDAEKFIEASHKK